MLNDADERERREGMRAGWAWYKVAEACVIYGDLGISDGMLYGIDMAVCMNVKIEPVRYILQASKAERDAGDAMRGKDIAEAGSFSGERQ